MRAGFLSVEFMFVLEVRRNNGKKYRDRWMENDSSRMTISLRCAAQCSLFWNRYFVMPICYPEMKFIDYRTCLRPF